MSTIGVITPQQANRPEWQWGDYYPQTEDEQRRAYVMDCLTRVTWDDDADFFEALIKCDEWLKMGKFPPAPEKKTKTVLKTL